MTVLHETLECDAVRNAARVARLARMAPKPRPVVIKITQPVEPEPIQVEEVIRVPVKSTYLHPINKVIRAACWHFGLPRKMLIGPSRKHRHTYPRQVAIYVARMAGYSLPEVGRRFNRDHTTAIHSARKIARLLAEDERVAADCEDIARAIGEAS